MFRDNPLLFRRAALAAASLAVASAAWADPDPTPADTVRVTERSVDRTDTNRDVDRNISSHRDLLRDFLGLEVAPLTRDDLANYPDKDLKPGVGLKVVKLEHNGRAELAGIHEGDVLVRVSNQWIINEPQLLVLLAMHDADDAFEVMTYRRDGSEIRRIDQDFKFDQAALDTLTQDNERLAMASIDGRTERSLTRTETDRDHVRVSDRDDEQARREAAAATGGLIVPEKFDYRDDVYKYDLRTEDGVKKLTVKDRDGNVVFDGPYNTKAERDAVPAEIKSKFEAALRREVK